MLIFGILILLLTVIITNNKRSVAEAACKINTISSSTVEAVTKTLEEEVEPTSSEYIAQSALHLLELKRMDLKCSLNDYLQRYYYGNVLKWSFSPGINILEDESLWLHVTFKNNMCQKFLVCKLPSTHGFEFKIHEAIEKKEETEAADREEENAIIEERVQKILNERKRIKLNNDLNIYLQSKHISDWDFINEKHILVNDDLWLYVKFDNGIEQKLLVKKVPGLIGFMAIFDCEKNEDEPEDTINLSNCNIHQKVLI